MWVVRPKRHPDSHEPRTRAVVLSLFAALAGWARPALGLVVLFATDGDGEVHMRTAALEVRGRPQRLEPPRPNYLIQ